MTNEETIQGTKSIADFMGYEKDGVFYSIGVINHLTFNNRKHHEEQLCFHLSWDWIMPVIRKINGLGKEYQLAIFKNYVSCTVEKGGKFYKDFSFSHAEYITGEQDDITAAFKLVVRFVEWYNVNVKAKEELKINE
jgi:hypothetical protein